MVRTSCFQQPISARSFFFRVGALIQEVLVGLTFAETREFELLDAEPTVDEHGNLLRWETDESYFRPTKRDG
jgi:hypothetical protein